MTLVDCDGGCACEEADDFILKDRTCVFNVSLLYEQRETHTRKLFPSPSNLCLSLSLWVHDF